MVTYLHPERFTLRTFVRVTPHERGHLEILPCKFLFACRQFVMDDSKRPKYFELKAAPEVNVIRMESSTSSKIAVVSELIVNIHGNNRDITKKSRPTSAPLKVY